jgi:hypothetical protein
MRGATGRRPHLDRIRASGDPDVGIHLDRDELDDRDDLVRASYPVRCNPDGVAGEGAGDRLHGDGAFLCRDGGGYQSGEVISTCTSRPARMARIRWPRGHSVQPRS